MDIFAIILLLLVTIGFKPMKHNPDYIGRDTTTAIKGIFAMFIIYNHGNQYFIPIGGGKFDTIYHGLLEWTGQLMVVMFLLYSGYGILESYKRKKSDYLDGFMKKRVLKTLVHFDLAVAVFVILAMVLGHEYSLQQYLLSFTGWDSIGNSNWFIFDIIVLYLIAYAGLIITERRGWDVKRYVCLVYGGTFVFLLSMLRLKEVWWWDTVLAFPTGMLWSAYRSQLERRLRSQRAYALTTLTVLLLFLAFYYLGQNQLAIFLIFRSALFGILVVLITMRCHIGNKALHWLGINAFAIYILQRLPMIIATECGLHSCPVLFMAVVIPMTLLMAAGFTRLTDRIDRKLFA